MRRFIETAPRDGTFVILEEDASGKYKIACWSPEARGWVDESDKPIKITPAYWHTMHGTDLQQETDPSFHLRCAASQTPIAHAMIASRSVTPAPPTVAAGGGWTAPIETKPASQSRWKFTATSIAASLLVAAFTSIYFSDDIISYARRITGLHNIFEVGTIGGPVVNQASRSSENEQDQRILSKDLAEARRTVEETNLKLQSEAAAAAQTLGQERERTAALTQELDVARQALTASTDRNRQALDEERARSGALANELATARRDLETKVALASKTGDEAAQIRKAAEATAAELRRSLQAERDKVATLARDLETAQRAIGARAAAPGRPANSQTGQTNSQTNSVAQPAAAEQPATSEVQGNPETSRLMSRDSALLAQGNIGAARIVFERAVELGSAEAVFALAETYDPHVLSSWGTYGTRGDASKARELYAKASAGGIQKARDRLNALR